MRSLPILSAVLLTAATPVAAQVTIDLHALQALPDRSATPRLQHQSPAASTPSAPMVVRREPSPTTRPATPRAAATGPAATGAAATGAAATGATPTQSTPLEAGQSPPSLPETVPDVASINPVAPPPPPPGGLPAPAVSDKATTAAAPTTTGLRLTFAPGDSTLSPDSSASIKQLTEAAPPGDATTFNVLAFAPGKADDPSTARRVSLSRAMSVRGALVADGVPSARIFVRALGEQYGDGPPDRVDVSVTGPSSNNTATSR